MSSNITHKDGVELSVQEEKESLSTEASGSSDNLDATTLFIYFVSEVLGTAMLMFFGCMGLCVTKIIEYPIPPQFGALSFGLTVLIVIQALGHVSGAHLNPQVTLAALILNTIKPICFPVYVTAQFIGACIGYGSLKLVIPVQYSEGVCETLPEKNMTDLQALVVEIVLTGCLILVCAGVWNARNAHNTDSTPIRFGLVVACLSMVGGPFTGASMNTARTFAPIFINGHWTSSHWIYWLGPTVGAVLAALLSRFILNMPKKSKLCI